MSDITIGSCPYPVPFHSRDQLICNLDLPTDLVDRAGAPQERLSVMTENKDNNSLSVNLFSMADADVPTMIPVQVSTLCSQFMCPYVLSVCVPTTIQVYESL